MSFLFSVLINFVLILVAIFIYIFIFVFVKWLFDFLVEFFFAHPKASIIFLSITIIFLMAVAATIEYGILLEEVCI